MTKDQVIELAKQAGFPVTDYGSGPFIDDGVTTQMIEALIKLVRNSVLEEAAQLMEDQDTQAPKYNAKAIRAMKETI
jgi:hypothetical protein